MIEQTSQRTVVDAMQRALTIAARGPAENANPQVGCVFIDADGRIVAEGWHEGAGTPHAETSALARIPAEWRDRMAELTAVVTLEPCNHTGRTGPCAVALADAGVGAVVYALKDPGKTEGGGSATLQAAGISVTGGVLAAESQALLRGWLDRQAAAAASAQAASHGEEPVAAAAIRLPRVIVKWAQTLDGRAAAADGSSQWITGPEARADVHVRRAQADAILVGTGTLLADDPSLTARAADGSLLVPAAEQPIPVVLGRREIPAGAKILAHPALAGRGLAAPIRLSGEDLAADFAELGARGITSVFVEGGPKVASAIITAGLADEVLVYVAPAFLGGEKLAVGDLGIASMAGIVRLDRPQISQLGDDFLVTAALTTNTEEN